MKTKTQKVWLNLTYWMTKYTLITQNKWTRLFILINRRLSRLSKAKPIEDSGAFKLPNEVRYSYRWIFISFLLSIFHVPDLLYSFIYFQNTFAGAREGPQKSYWFYLLFSYIISRFNKRGHGWIKKGPRLNKKGYGLKRGV